MRCAIRLTAGGIRGAIGRLAADPGGGGSYAAAAIARHASTGTGSAPGAGGVPPASQSRPGPVGLVSLTGAPISSASAGPDGAGAEITLTTQNATQIIQSPGAMLFQVGTLTEAVSKKLTRLRVAAGGRLPLVRVVCKTVPQICEALQIRSEPTVLLMARGQAVAALENDLSPQAVTRFVEHTAQLFNLKVDLAEGTTELLAEAEDTEWTDPAEAGRMFTQIGAGTDLQMDARVRVVAGQARCALRQGAVHRAEAQARYAELDTNGHSRLPEVRQVAAMLRLDRRDETTPPLDTLCAAAQAAPADFAAVEAYALALFWAGRPVEAFDAGLALLRRQRTDDVRQLVLSLVEALGPRHPKSAASRKAFNSALFV